MCCDVIILWLNNRIAGINSTRHSEAPHTLLGDIMISLIGADTCE